MNHEGEDHDENKLRTVPEPKRELTWQAVLSAVIVAALVSASYPYVVLKLGLGPNVSVVSAFLGAVLLLILAPRTHGRNRLTNNIVQTAGTSASMTAFMCVVAAAVDFTAKNRTVADQLNGIERIDPWPMFAWLSCAGGIGVLVMVLFRRHFVEDPKLVFADGVAAAETITVLDSRGREAAGKLGTLGVCALAAALVNWLREGIEKLPNFFPTAGLKSFRIGLEWSLLTVGTGMLISLAVSLSMLAGTVIVAGAGPTLLEQGIGKDIVLQGVAAEVRPEIGPLLDKGWGDLTPQEQEFVKKHGGRNAIPYLQKDYFPVVLLWFMWPATALMITSSLTAVLLQWRSVAASFAQLRLRRQAQDREDMSLRTVIIGSAILAVALALIQRHNFGMSYTQSAVAVLCSLPLILVGVRVLGETNFGPISVMMNGLQAIFGVFWPGSVGHNLIAAGMAGTCNAQGEGTIQDYKTGQILGSTPRVLTWVQLAAVPIGAAAVAIMYPLLLERYPLGDKLLAPTGLKISNMAVLLAQGVDALPRGALAWTVFAAVTGVILVAVKHFFHSDWLPSGTGLGLGLLLPGTLIVPVAIGGTLGWVWQKVSPASHERYVVTVASGFIAGEALLGGLVLPAISWFWGA
jgi:uncharacterized oligopeptide transporter (OPT) family protein